MCTKTNQRLSTFQCKCSFPSFFCPEKPRWWDSNGPGACRGGGSVLCRSPCELVRDSTRTMSARSHCKITSSIAPSRCPPTTAARAPLIRRPRVPESAAPCVGVTCRRPRASTCTCGHRRFLWEAITWSRLTEQDSALPPGLRAFSWCEDGWALKFSVEAKSPARHAVWRTVVLLEGARCGICNET